MITDSNLIKLLDFGESKNLLETDSDILEITRTGTPFFMAPELRKL
jgi:serine/threonine protein kinase